MAVHYATPSRREDAESILQGCGIEIDGDRIRLNQTAVKSTLLQKTEFRKSNMTEILCREKSANRISDGKKRWIELDLEIFLRGSGEKKVVDDGF